MARRTLLLTPYYLPVKVLRWQDAVKMKYEGTVDVVVEYDEEIRSPSVTWKVPAVVRLRRMPGSMKKGVKFSRGNVYQRDGYKCQYCGEKKPSRELTYDHVVPRSAGGRTEWRNIVSACKACNGRKRNLTCDEAGMWPRNQPAQPKSLPVTSPMLDRDDMPEEWFAFVRNV